MTEWCTSRADTLGNCLWQPRTRNPSGARVIRQCATPDPGSGARTDSASVDGEEDGRTTKEPGVRGSRRERTASLEVRSGRNQGAPDKSGSDRMGEEEECRWTVALKVVAVDEPEGGRGGGVVPEELLLQSETQRK